jgi:hypothetical protein
MPYALHITVNSITIVKTFENILTASDHMAYSGEIAFGYANDLHAFANRPDFLQLLLVALRKVIFENKINWFNFIPQLITGIC